MDTSDFDLIILGAGTAGCMAAYKAAKEGLNKIALIDRKSKENIGNKICGDGIGTKHIEFLETLGFPIKENNIIANALETAHILSPSKEKDYTIPLKNQLTIINRHAFGQMLLNEALNLGVKLFSNTTFGDYKRRAGKITLKAKDQTGKIHSFRSTLLIDASGANSRIREELDDFGPYSKVQDDEQYYCFREICTIDNLPEYYSNSAIFEFGYNSTRGGYKWYFSRGSNQLNMGVGVPKIWAKDFPPKGIYQNEMSSKFSISEVVNSGGGFVPTRHPIPSHVKNNLILIGDAGAIVNPLHGGGLSASLFSGHLASKIAVSNIANEAVTESDLWIYNQELNERYGKRYSLLDFYRILLQNIPDEELDKAFMNDYLPLGMLFYAREYDDLYTITKELEEMWLELPNHRFLLLPKHIEQIHQLTNNYPKTPEELPEWAKNYHDIYQSYKSQIQIE